MRRADRLFRIIQILRRRTRRPITAAEMAGELETSLRTVYRDIAQLMADRVPIRGEAGIGYVLDNGFDMPPLMLNADEVEAAMLGAQWVMGRGDPVLARAAHDLVSKIGQVIPDHLRPLAMESALISPNWRPLAADAIDMTRLRAAIHGETKLSLNYRDEKGAQTPRIVWPIAISYFEAVRTIIAWCELRKGFRSFRTDRVMAAEFLGQRYPVARSRLTAQWRKEMRERIAKGDYRKREAQQPEA